MSDEVGGVFPVLPTIFTADGSLDIAGFEAVAEYAIGCGIDGVVFPGLASEYDMLSLDERLHLIGIIGRIAQGRAKFIVGASSNSLEDSVTLARAGAAAGAIGAMVVTPRADGADLQKLRTFYTALGDQASLPIMVQNAPAPMGLGLSAEQVLSIVEATGTIAWIKEENMPCGQRISRLLAASPAGLRGVFGGAGGRYIIDELTRGAIGTMPAAETPEVHVALMKAQRSGDAARVRALYEAMLPILMMQAVFRWRLTKEVLRRKGLIASAHTRAPGPEFDDGDHAELSRILERLEGFMARR
jgi:4-hydroxy-tetrahydrodipicolinate synthase